MNGGGIPPIAGWYPDPSTQSSYRWWDGNAWTTVVWSDKPRPRDQSRLAVQILLSVASAVLWIVAGTLAILLPLLVISDADNGQLNWDFTTLWLPDFVVAVGGAVTCLLALGYEKRRPDLWRILAIPVAAVVLVVLVGFGAPRVR
jgi:hypothetical protein